MSFCGKPRIEHFCHGYSCSFCPACLARIKMVTVPSPDKALETLRDTDLCNNVSKYKTRLCKCGFSTSSPKKWLNHQEKIHGA